MPYLITKNLDDTEQTLSDQLKQAVEAGSDDAEQIAGRLDHKALYMAPAHFDVMLDVIDYIFDDLSSKPPIHDGAFFGRTDEERAERLQWYFNRFRDCDLDRESTQREVDVSAGTYEAMCRLLSKFARPYYWNGGGFGCATLIRGTRYFVGDAPLNEEMAEKHCQMSWEELRDAICRFFMFYEGRHGFTILRSQREFE